jgi:hypothetical protein
LRFIEGGRRVINSGRLALLLLLLGAAGLKLNLLYGQVVVNTPALSL